MVELNMLLDDAWDDVQDVCGSFFYKPFQKKAPGALKFTTQTPEVPGTVTYCTAQVQKWFL